MIVYKSVQICFCKRAANWVYTNSLYNGRYHRFLGKQSKRKAVGQSKRLYYIIQLSIESRTMTHLSSGAVRISDINSNVLHILVFTFYNNKGYRLCISRKVSDIVLLLGVYFNIYISKRLKTVIIKKKDFYLNKSNLRDILNIFLQN